MDAIFLDGQTDWRCRVARDGDVTSPISDGRGRQGAGSQQASKRRRGSVCALREHKCTSVLLQHGLQGPEGSRKFAVQVDPCCQVRVSIDNKAFAECRGILILLGRQWKQTWTGARSTRGGEAGGQGLQQQPLCGIAVESLGRVCSSDDCLHHVTRNQCPILNPHRGQAGVKLIHCIY